PADCVVDPIIPLLCASGRLRSAQSALALRPRRDGAAEERAGQDGEDLSFAPRQTPQWRSGCMIFSQKGKCSMLRKSSKWKVTFGIGIATMLAAPLCFGQDRGR